MKNMALKFGLIAGGIIFAYSYVVFFVLLDFSTMTPKDLEMAQWFGFIRYIVLLLGVIMAMIADRRSVTGPMSYGRSFRVGLLVALVTAVFVGLMEYLYVAFANPEFYNQFAALTLEGMKKSGATAA